MSAKDFLLYTIAGILIVYSLAYLIWLIINECRHRKWLKKIGGMDYYENLKELQEKLNAKDYERTEI